MRVPGPSRRTASPAGATRGCPVVESAVGVKWGSEPGAPPPGWLVGPSVIGSLCPAHSLEREQAYAGPTPMRELGASGAAAVAKKFDVEPGAISPAVPQAG